MLFPSTAPGADLMLFNLGGISPFLAFPSLPHFERVRVQYSYLFVRSFPYYSYLINSLHLLVG
jgi:hypothetical protein